MATFTTSDGLALHYTDEGTGLPILCLAGLTRNTGDFAYVAPHLTDHRVIRMDYRGRGQSEWAKDYMSYAIPIEARDAIELLDHLQINKAAILGNSRGGLIGMALAAGAKDRMLGLCMNDIGPVIEEAGLAFIAGYLGRDPSVNSYAEAAELRAIFMEDFKGVPASRWMEEVKSHYQATPERLINRYDPKLRDAVLANMPPPGSDAWPLFDALDGLPIALVRGVGSNILSLETAKEMARRRPDMLWAELNDRGHVPFLDEPDALAVIHKWIGQMT